MADYCKMTKFVLNVLPKIPQNLFVQKGCAGKKTDRASVVRGWDKKM